MAQRTGRFNHLIYLLAVIILSWSPWFLAVATGQGMDVLAVKILLMFGLFGPALAAILLMYIGKNGEAHWDYWRRLVDPTLITGKRWWAVFVIPPIVSVVAVVISLLFGSSVEQLHLAAQLRTHFLSVLFFLLYTFFIGPVPEEMGWRGYWLDRLARKCGVFKASWYIGLAWVLWRVPLIFVKGYPLAACRTDWVMMVSVFGSLMPQSFILSYIYYKNDRSTLAAVIFHFMINFTGTILVIDHRSQLIQLGLYILLAIVLVAGSRGIFFRAKQTPAA